MISDIKIYERFSPTIMESKVSKRFIDIVNTSRIARSIKQENFTKRLFNKIKAGGKGGRPGQWSARKAQMLAKQYKAAGGGYK